MFFKHVRDRKVFKSKLNINFFLNGYNLKHLFIKQFSSLNKKEVVLIKDFYCSNDKNDIRDLLISNKILPFGANIFIKLNLDKKFWLSDYYYYLNRNKKIKKLLNLIFKKFDILKCDSITLIENFAVVLSTNSNIACFSSGDVDLSANILEKNKIVRCLNEFGFHCENKQDEIREYSGQSMQFYNSNFLDDGFWINVIWKPVTRAFLIQDKYDIRLNKDRLNYKIINNSRIRVLNDTSLMYFCCLHIASGHYYTLSPGLRLYYDIDRLSLRGKIDWHMLKSWEKKDSAGLRISLTLVLCKKIFNSPIPIKIFDSSLKNKRNQILMSYLYDKKNNILQNKSSLIRRLYVELSSDNKNLIISLIYRLYKYLFSK